MGRMIFYEDKNYQGRRYECESNNTNFHSYLRRCNSAHVETGTWVIYERPNYSGHQYVLTRSEYPDYTSWNGLDDRVSSCKMIHVVANGDPSKIQLYSKGEFAGPVFEVTEDCPSVLEFPWREVHSCRVLGGWRVFYEHPNYKGHQYLLEKGEYRKPVDWGAVCPTVQSFRRLTE